MEKILEQGRRKLKKQGLELRVEPSFGFFATDTSDPEGHASVEKRLVNYRKDLVSFDLNLYTDGKLCLSPQDVENKNEYEPLVRRDVKRKVPREFFISLLNSIIRKMPPNLRRVYEIPDFDVSGVKTDYESGDYIHLVRKVNGLMVDILFKFGEELSDEELIKQLWAREYPQNRFADKTIVNDLSIFFVQQAKLEVYRPFERAAATSYNIWHDNSEIIRTSDASILSLSNGYRLRIVYPKNGEIADTVKTFLMHS